MQNNTLLCCDWGTSFFRIRLVNTVTFSNIVESVDDHGIASVFRQWQQENRKDRIRFYLDILNQHISKLEKTAGISLKNIPIIISGMASSTLGIMEVDYADLPFETDGSGINVKRIASSKPFQHEVYIISGVKANADVMRGEETQLVGAAYFEKGKQVVLLPGTHSKHVFIKNGKVVNFKTYMTGEFFELLSKKSILHSSIENIGEFESKEYLTSFTNGLFDIQKGNLLNACFQVRTNSLFKKANPRENYFYLSGLLIGQELKDLAKSSYRSILLVSNKRLEPFYVCGVKSLLPGWKIEIENAGYATIKGQVKIYKHLISTGKWMESPA